MKYLVTVSLILDAESEEVADEQIESALMNSGFHSYSISTVEVVEAEDNA